MLDKSIKVTEFITLHATLLDISVYRYTGLSSLTRRDLTAIPKPENTSTTSPDRKELFADEFST